jgi:hypothetical protein
MKFEPIDLSLERPAAGTRAKQLRPRSAADSRPHPAGPHQASPEAVDEVFAALSPKSAADAGSKLPTSFAKPSLHAAPLVALEANLQRQHERLAILLREIDSSISA